MKKGQKMTAEQCQRLSAAHMGQVAWNKGVPMPEEVRAKVSEAKMGSVSWNKGKPSPWLSERNLVNNPQKKGAGATPWKGGRVNYNKRQAKKRDDYTCQKCGLRDEEIVQADHIKPIADFPELEHDMGNMMTLCPNCHVRKTLREKKARHETRRLSEVMVYLTFVPIMANIT